MHNQNKEREKLLKDHKELSDAYDALTQRSEINKKKVKLIQKKIDALANDIELNRKKIEKIEDEERKMVSNFEFETKKIKRIENEAIPKLNVSSISFFNFVFISIQFQWQFQAEIGKETKVLDRLNSQASAAGPRIESTQTVEQIESKMKKLEQKML